MSQYTFEQTPRFGGPRIRITWAVQRLIIFNVIVFALQLLLHIPLGRQADVFGQLLPPGGRIIEWLSFQPTSLLVGCVWQPFTYMFLHHGLLHLFGNMLWLFFFGPEVERVLSTRQFFRFYILCGAIGVLATFVPFVLQGRATSVLGASGAVMGVLVAFAVINPDRELVLFPFPIRISARGLVIIVIVWNIVTSLGGGGVSVATHFGGLAAGFAYMKSVPALRQWIESWQRARQPKKKPKDPVADAVDNIFKFEEEKRRRK